MKNKSNKTEYVRPIYTNGDFDKQTIRIILRENTKTNVKMFAANRCKKGLFALDSS